MNQPLLHGVPEMSAPSFALLRRALGLGWRDFLAAPAFGIFVAVLCCV